MDEPQPELPPHTNSLRESSYDARVRSGEIGSRFEDVVVYTMPEAIVDLARMQQLEGRFGYNGGRGCDVRSGPCSCGAWH